MYEEQLVIQRIFKSLESNDNKDHHIRVLSALKSYNDGFVQYQNNNIDEAVKLLEEALKQIEPVKEAANLQAMVKGQLVAYYAMLGSRLKEALTLGKEAVNVLAKEPLLEEKYAQCLLNLGGILTHSDPKGSIVYLDRALMIYQILQNGEKGASICEENIKTARENLENAKRQPQSKSSWWSRLFKKT